jgi:type II secretory pathway pseudopilin PulG
MTREREAGGFPMSAARNEAGFSLTELLVAMLVTMIVSGAVFTLLNAGQGAFRREPELTDRQQNIRLAMDLIQRDISVAGAGMDPSEQAFSVGDGPNDTAPLLNAFPGGGTGPSAEVWDVLEIMGADGSCNDVPVPNAVAGSQVTAAFNLPACFPGQPPGQRSLVAVGYPTAIGGDTVFWGLAGPNAGQIVEFAGGQPVKSEIVGGNPPAGTPSRVVPIQIARYQILEDTQGVPNLWRSGQGGLNAAGALTAVGDPAGRWELVARGIEDLQVRYRMEGELPIGQGGRCDPNLCGSPLVVDPANPATIVKEVEVTLWARAIAQNLQGQTSIGGAAAAVRGSLVTISSPRAALMALNGMPGPSGPRRWR